MKTIRKKVLVLCLLPLLGTQAFAYDIQADLARLDAALAVADNHSRSKEQLLASLNNMLNYPNLPARQQLGIYHEIFNETYPYSFDLALAAVNSAEKVAANLGYAEKADVMLDKVLLFATAGFFMEAQETFSQIDTTRLSTDQRISYYYAMQRYWKDYKDYSDGKMLTLTPRASRYRYYREAYIAETPKSSFWHNMLQANNLLDDNNYMAADALCAKILSETEPLTHEYAIAAYWRGVACEALGRRDEQMHWYIESAIADINNAVKDNASISTIANLLLSEDIERASRYIQISLEDAMAYNAKLRPWQIARLIPAIEMGYKQEKAKNDSKVRSFTIGISVFAVFLLLFISILIYALRKTRNANRKLEEQRLQLEKDERELAEANAKLKSALKQLSDANKAKREYIALFLTMCSGYIDKLKKHITMDEREAELKNFYNAFDNAFLQLYPDFVEQFNALLRPEERIVLKKDERLTTELRIFALIRLGITQSSHIASLLRYSVNTIYNYRAQVKNAALDQESDFEKSVRNIENHDF